MGFQFSKTFSWFLGGKSGHPKLISLGFSNFFLASFLVSLARILEREKGQSLAEFSEFFQPKKPTLMAYL
jgi:hypothetical protein